MKRLLKFKDLNIEEVNLKKQRKKSNRRCQDKESRQR